MRRAFNTISKEFRLGEIEGNIKREWNKPWRDSRDIASRDEVIIHVRSKALFLSPLALLRPSMLRVRRPFRTSLIRFLCSSSRRAERPLFDPTAVERAEDDVDVCIVGAGPAGLSAAIRLKQLEKETGKEVRVVVLEKGPEVGA